VERIRSHRKSGGVEVSGDGAEIGFETGFSLPEASGRKAPEPGRIYDVIVLGAGPAGLSAAIYLIRKGLDTAILTGNIGGQVTWTASIENYLGYRLVEGVRLVEQFNEQLRQFEAALGLNEEVVSTDSREDHFEVRTASAVYTARSLVLATGKRPRTLNVPGEKELLGRGVAYCAICDAPLYRGKVTAVVGGGNSGLEAAIDLAAGCPKVFIVERDEELSGDDVLKKRIGGLSNVEVLTGTEVTAILGEDRVRAITMRGTGVGVERELAVEGIFVEIGLDPNSEAFGELAELNEWGEVVVDCRGRTSRPGVFAAGDVTSVPYKQIVIAAGEGAKAALSAHDWLLRGGGR